MNNIYDLEKDQDIPPPGRISKFNTKDLYNHRPPPSVGTKTLSNNSNQTTDGLKNISNIDMYKI